MQSNLPPCRHAESRGVNLEGLLWLLPLPRVHAASPPAPSCSPVTLPQHLDKPELPDTGWDRIKDLFHRREMQPYPEEVTNVLKSTLAAALLGVVYGGVPGARYARQRFIQHSQAEVFKSRVDAIRSCHNAAIRGFVRYGWRWGWRVAAFVTLFNTVSTGLSVYHDQDSVTHYAVAGAVTGGAFRASLGLGGLLVGSLIGAGLGVPTGALIMAMHKLTGETTRERYRRERKELHQLRLAEWSARMQVTDEMIGEMSSSGQHHDSKSDLQKIQELLSLPRNESVTKDSDNQ